MLKNDTLKNGTSRVGLYGSAPPPGHVNDQKRLNKTVSTTYTDKKAHKRTVKLW